ncbi:iron ABC transporter permease [Corynebacterium striatum]|uniref:FecCD family ABC transporter permease n=1 Tax=Corynebacterium striatum TaxID=43770 RepID=UPI001A28704F|nr:iron ABC transporter permease [Corynebacterium striatum]
MPNQTSSASTSATLQQQRHARARSFAWRLSVLAVIIVVLWATSLMVGETFYGPGKVLRVVFGETVPGASFTVGDLRLPRATVAVAAGIAFGIAGVTFQTMLRNQLASPDIIGISSGASAAGITAIVFYNVSQTTVSLVSLVCSLTIAALIYLLSLKSGFTGTRLILIGIGMSAILQAWTNFVLSKAPSYDLPTATRWITGSLNTMSWERGLPLLLTVLVIAPVMIFLGHQLNVLRLGDDLAVGLGLRLNVVRVSAIVGAVLLIAVATASTGPIAFVAFMAGPIATRLFKAGPSMIAPAGSVGAILVLVADMAGQYFFGTRYPVGVITGVLGAPFLIYLLTRSNR